MAETTKIQWTHHTFNPWRGCTKVAPGCANCYAAVDRSVSLHGIKWGPNGTRQIKAESGWKDPIRWNRAAVAAGERRRVFCASLADVFEGRETMPDNAWEAVETARQRLFAVIDQTPDLDWLLLTKRPENIRKMWPLLADKRTIFPGCPGPLGEPQPCMVEGARRANVWLGTSISDQNTAAKALPKLIGCRNLAPVLFLSAEPLLGPIEFSDVTKRSDVIQQLGKRALSGIDWVIAGGESGPDARPCDPKWIRSIVKQCKAANARCFVKQLGANIVLRNDEVEDQFNNNDTGWPDPHVEYDIHGYRENFQGADCRVWLQDKKGGNPDEWPADLRVRQFPKALR